MNVFKLALKVAARHWQYLLVYLAAFVVMALVGSGAVQVATSDEFHEDMPKVAVIDRDGSALSSALSDFALRDSVAVQVEDSTFGLQDTAAKDLANYVLIIPEGFEDDLVAAAREGGEPPVLDTVISYQSARGSLANQRVGRGGGRQQKTGRKARGRQRAAPSGSLGRGGTGGYTGAADNQLSAQKTAPPFAFAKQRGKRFACAPGGVAPASAIQRANSRKVHQYQPPHSEARRHRIQ